MDWGNIGTRYSVLLVLSTSTVVLIPKFKFKPIFFWPVESEVSRTPHHTHPIPHERADRV